MAGVNVILRVFNPCSERHFASYDVANNVCRALNHVGHELRAPRE